MPPRCSWAEMGLSLNSLVAAAVLALPHLVLPAAAPAGAADETRALSNPQGTHIVNPTVTGAILDRDGSPTVWLASFGRTATLRSGDRSGHHLRAGVGDSQVILGGCVSICGGAARKGSWRELRTSTEDDGGTGPGTTSHTSPMTAAPGPDRRG